MKKISTIILLCALICCTSMFLRATETFSNNNAGYLANRLSKTDPRYPSFLLVLELLEHRQAKILIETGTARDGDKNFSGDGGSTIILGDWASQNHAKLSTVDISVEAIENAKKSAQRFGCIDFFCCDSVSFLKNYDQSIDFLYLDSFDFDFSNPHPSQEHHLKEVVAAYSKLHAKSIVMIDDCGLPYGGKGKLAIEFLLMKGWTIIYNGYQTILVQ